MVSSYPLITAYPSEGKKKILTPKPQGVSKIYITRMTSNQAFLKAISICRDGGIVLWIENTVNEAQRRYFDFLESGILAPGILHSRYTPIDRNKNEEFWIGVMGVNGDRSKGRIIVSTQVCEQSLDIDADILISALCPIDMFLQRIGRLWRHRKNDANRKVKRREVLWFSPNPQRLLDSNIDSFRKDYGESAYVYHPYVLVMSYLYLIKKKDVIIPTEIPLSLESVYDCQPPIELLSLYNDLQNSNNEIKAILQTAINQDKMLSDTNCVGKVVDECEHEIDELEPIEASTRYSTTLQVPIALLNVKFGLQKTIHDGVVFNGRPMRHILDESTVKFPMRLFAKIAAFVKEYPGLDGVRFIHARKINDRWVFIDNSGEVVKDIYYSHVIGLVED